VARRGRDGGDGSSSDTYAYFALAGHFDPNEVTDLLRIEPTAVALTGDPVREGASLTHKLDFWRLESPLSIAMDPVAHIEAVIDQLRPATASLRDLSEMHEAGMFVAIYLRSAQGPFARLGPPVLNWLVSVNAFLDLDVYAMPDD